MLQQNALEMSYNLVTMFIVFAAQEISAFPTPGLKPGYRNASSHAGVVQLSASSSSCTSSGFSTEQHLKKLNANWASSLLLQAPSLGDFEGICIRDT